jgi:hypothetical protein
VRPLHRNSLVWIPLWSGIATKPKSLGSIMIPARPKALGSGMAARPKVLGSGMTARPLQNPSCLDSTWPPNTRRLGPT